MGRRSPTPRVIELLVACLDDDAPAVAEAAADGLHALSPASAPSADALLAAGTPTALRALSRLRDGRVVPILSAALADDHPAPWTGDALESHGPLALEVRDRVIALLPALPAQSYGPDGHDNRHIQFTSWLGELSPDGGPAVPAIVDVLNAGYASRAAVLALGALGPVAADARPALERHLHDDDLMVRAQAAASLWRVDGDHDPLLQVIDDLLVEPQRGALAEALDAIDEFPWERLEPLLEHPDEWVRRPAARAIWRLTGDDRTVSDTLRALAAPTPAGEAALSVLAEMPRETAIPLREQLERWLGSDRRLIEWAASGDIVERDERLRELPLQLLTSD